MLLKLFKNPIFLIFENFYLVIFPLAFIFLNPWILPYRIPILAVNFGYIYFVSRISGITLTAMGITSKNIIKSVAVSLFIAIAICILFLVLYLYVPSVFSFPELVTEYGKLPHMLVLILYMTISAPIQELILRGFYIARLELVSKNRLFLILYSAIVFAFVHGVFQNKLMVPLTFFLGLFLGWLFLKYRNLLGPVLLHGMVGAFLFWLVLL